MAWKGRTDPVREMIPLEEARALVCGAVEKLPVETVELLDAVGRVVAADQISDIDVSPFAHSAMDGFALRAAEIADAAELSQTHGAAHKPDDTDDTERGHKADTDGAAFAAAEYIAKLG